MVHQRIKLFTEKICTFVCLFHHTAALFFSCLPPSCRLFKQNYGRFFMSLHICSVVLKNLNFDGKTSLPLVNLTCYLNVLNVYQLSYRLNQSTQKLFFLFIILNQTLDQSSQTESKKKNQSETAC